MSVSGSNGGSAPKGSDMSGPDRRNAAARQRLAEALRANLGRRRVQQRERDRKMTKPVSDIEASKDY
ncbi:MAG: hypothetical protein L0Y50_04915 [Beijerinckiaceae bacterium]|nr:hypothetical protein [Beijerinckiaceae bacterium]MCI0735601.1 hypothetical protein [Beijerinckiaceae bacterium]